MKTKGLRLLTPPLVLVLFYWTFGLSYLTVLPRVYEDEPWQASTGIKLAREGVFASDLFEGLWGMEEHYYGFLPVYPAALALVYLIADVGLFQTRWVGIVCGVLILALTFSLARRIWHDPRIGVLALVLLMAVHWFGETKLHPTGILFLDATRIARYDVLVPVFGLLAIHAFLSARSVPNRLWYLVAGLLVGFGGLTHLYGLFLLPILMLLVVWERKPGWLFEQGLLLSGVVVVWLPYIAYVLADLPAWQMQTRLYAARFDIFDPQWYLENMRAEHERYALGSGRLHSLILRPGVWFSFLFLLLASVGMLPHLRTNPRVRVVLLPLVLLPLAYAFLLQLKFINYLFLVLPFAALVSAWGLVAAWDGLARGKKPWLRVAVALALVLILVEGMTRLAAFQAQAATTTPYAVLSARLRSFIPPGSRVVGLQNYWFGWDGYAYRSIAVPWMLVQPELNPSPPSLSAAMNAQRPDYILLDDSSRLYLSQNVNNLTRGFDAWMQERKAVRIVNFTDSSYGRFEIFRVEQTR